MKESVWAGDRCCSSKDPGNEVHRAPALRAYLGTVRCCKGNSLYDMGVCTPCLALRSMRKVAMWRVSGK